LFAALTIHSIIIRRADPVRRQLAENRSRQCMLGLSELSKSWPVGGWILHLFVQLMERLTGRDFTMDRKARPNNKRKRTASSGAQTEYSNSVPPRPYPSYPNHGELQEGHFAPDYNPYGLPMDYLQHPGHFQDHHPSAKQEALWRRDQLPLDFLLQDSFANFFSSGNNDWYSPEEISGSSLNGTVPGH